MTASGTALFIIYELAHLSVLEARLRAGDSLEVISLDFEVELELKKRGIAYTPLRSVARSCEGEREPIEVSRTAANEWYQHPELAFFVHDTVRLGEPHAGPLHFYFGMLLYYLVLLEQVMARPAERIIIPESCNNPGPGADPTAAFKERLPVDVARLLAERRSILLEVMPVPRRAPHSAWRTRVSTAFAQCATGVLNTLLGVLQRPRALRILSTDPWSRIEPFIKNMPEVEVVMTRRSEIPRMGLNIWRTRARFHHPLDFAGYSIWRIARLRAQEFRRAWDALGEHPEIAKLFEYHDISFWPLAKQVLAAIVKEHGEEAVAMQESVKALIHHYAINRVLLFGSTKGFNNLIAHTAERLDVPSIELQHALEVTEPSHPYAHLYARYLAAYGALTKKHYESFGVEPERIIETGSPRFDRYAEPLPPQHLVALRERLGLSGLTALVTLPDKYASLEPASFTAYSIMDLLHTFSALQQALPDASLLLRPRPGRDSLYERQEVCALFAAGTPWVQDEDLKTLLALCDIVVSGNSTVVLEAMLSKKPVLLYLPRAIDHDFDEYTRSGAVLLARTPEELRAHARSLLDPEIRAGVLARAEEFMRNNFSLDGGASARIRKFIRELPVSR
ncbi:hypothetical protein EXS62_02990 [Candidatus Kaiserbacteria bacterium]|nr:hypothetical protein [Candidatus Kaiserbacteria bacterium]